VTDTFAIGITIAVFALPCGLLAMAVRHFVSLMRGFNAPLWAYALGPIAFASNRFLSEAARPHRKPFIRYVSAFILVSLALLVVASGSLAWHL
jgi:hypothetical protein